MDRLKTISILAAAACAVSCGKEAIETEVIIGEDELVVSIAAPENASKSALDGVKTYFAAGDSVRVYDTAGNKAIYKFRTKVLKDDHFECVFQKGTSDAGFVKENFKAAFYPAQAVTGYDVDNNIFTAEFGRVQKFAENNIPQYAAPMACFEKPGGKDDPIVFTNQFGLIRFSFKYASAPATALKIDNITLSSTSSKLYGTYTFAESGVTYVSGGDTEISLEGCSAAGELGTSEKYYYVAVPGISTTTDEVMTVSVTPTAEMSDVPFSGKFKSNSDTDTKIIKNNILQLKPFILKDVVGGSYSVADWNQIDTIKVGQITVAKSEVTIKKGNTTDVQIHGVTTWSDVSATIFTGSGKFTIAKKEETGTPVKYYISITGTAACTDGEIYVNDEATNSGSYIYVTVTE